MEYMNSSYGYEVSTGVNGGVSVGEGGYCMEVITPFGKTFAREGYDSYQGATSGAIQSIENMQSSLAVMGRVNSLLEDMSFGSFLSTGLPGILNDDGRSA